MDEIIFDLTADDSDDQDSASVSCLLPVKIEDEHNYSNQEHKQISALSPLKIADQVCGESAAVTETQVEIIEGEDEADVIIQVPESCSERNNLSTEYEHFDDTLKTEEELPDGLGDNENFKNYYEPQVRKRNDSNNEGDNENQIQEPVMPIILCVETVPMSDDDDDDADKIVGSTDNTTDKEVKQEIDCEGRAQPSENNFDENLEPDQEVAASADQNDSQLNVSRESPVLPDVAPRSPSAETTQIDLQENNQASSQDHLVTDDKALLRENLELDREIEATSSKDKNDSQLNLLNESPVLPDVAPASPEPAAPETETKDSTEHNQAPVEDNKALLHQNLELDKENAASTEENNSELNTVRQSPVLPQMTPGSPELPPVENVERGSPENDRPDDSCLTEDKALLRENLQLDKEIAALTVKNDSLLNSLIESPVLPDTAAVSPDLAPVETTPRDSPENVQPPPSCEDPSPVDDKAVLRKTLATLQKKTSDEIETPSDKDKKLPVADIFAFMNKELSSINNEHLTPSDCKKLLEDSTFTKSEGDEHEEADNAGGSALVEKQILLKRSIFEAASPQKEPQKDPVDCASSTNQVLLKHSIFEAEVSQKEPQADPVDCASSEESDLKKKIADSSPDSKEGEDNSALLENPVQCLDCDYLAMNVQGLRVHTLSQHTTGRIYFCKPCKLKVSTGYDLKVHQMKVHPELFTRKCHECGYASRRTDDMQRHLVIAHRDNIIGQTTPESMLAMQKRCTEEEKNDGKRKYVDRSGNRIKLKTLLALGKGSYFQHLQQGFSSGPPKYSVGEKRKRRRRKKQLVFERQAMPKKKETEEGGGKDDDGDARRESTESVVKIKRRPGRPPNPLNVLKRQQKEQKKREAMAAAANVNRLSDSDVKTEQENAAQSEDGTLKRKRLKSFDYNDDKEDLLTLLDKFGGDSDDDDDTSRLILRRGPGRPSKKMKSLWKEQEQRRQQVTEDGVDRALEAGGGATSPASSKRSESSNQSASADQPKSELQSEDSDSNNKDQRRHHHEKKQSSVDDNIQPSSKQQQQQSSSKPLKCVLCPFTYATTSEMVEHTVKRHEGYRWRKCPHCPFHTCHSHVLPSHVEIAHFPKEGAVYVECRVCQYATSQMVHMRRHQKVHAKGAGTLLQPQNIWYVCKLCGYRCARNHHTITKHCTAEHQKNGRTCEACPGLGKFDKWSDLRRHFFAKHITKSVDVGNGSQQQQQGGGGVPPPPRENVGLPKTTSKIETKSITVISQPGSSKIKLKFQTKSHIVDGNADTNANLSSEEEEDEEEEEEEESSKTNVKISTTTRKSTTTTTTNKKSNNSSNSENNKSTNKRNKRKYEETSEDDEQQSVKKADANNSDASLAQFKCAKCPYRGRCQRSINMHVMNLHTPDHEREWHVCAVCPFKSKTRTNTISHMMYMHTNRASRCFMCRSSGVQFQNLRHHVRSQHKIKVARIPKVDSKQDECEDQSRSSGPGKKPSTSNTAPSSPGRKKAAKQNLLSAQAKMATHQNLSPKARNKPSQGAQLEKTKTTQKTNASQSKQKTKKRKRDLDLSMPHLEKMVEEIMQPGATARATNMTVQKVLKNPQITVKKETGGDKTAAVVAAPSAGCIAADTKRWYKCGHCTYKSLDTQSLTAHMLSHMNPTENVTLSISNVQKSNTSATLNHVASSLEKLSFPSTTNNNNTDGASGNTTSGGGGGGGGINDGSSSSSSEKVYRCFQCDFHTKNKYLLAGHINYHHLPDEQVTWYQCPCCEFKNKRKNYTSAHVRSKHPHVKRCPQCWYFAMSARDLDEHKEKMHLAIPNEISTADGLKLYTCNQQDCTQMYTLRGSAVRHIKSVHFGQSVGTSSSNSSTIATAEDSFSAMSSSNLDELFDNNKSTALATSNSDDKAEGLLYKCFICPYVGRKVSCLKSHITKAHKNKNRDSLEKKRAQQQQQQPKRKSQAAYNKREDHQQQRQETSAGSSSNESSFDCDVCPYSTTLYKFYETHMKAAHGRQMAKK